MATEQDDESPPPPATNQIARRTFAGLELAGDNGMTQALIAKSRADIEARWVMAMRNPRDLDEVRQLMLRECNRPGFAEVATYARPVGKKFNETTNEWEEQYAEGLSIRFAEVALRCMCNMTVESVTIFDSSTERMVRVTATDLESNGTWSRDVTIKKTVERKKLKKGQAMLGQRLNSYGDRVFIVEATDSEVTVKEAAEVSKASRTAILRLIPGHLQDEMFNRCRAVAADKDAKDPDRARNLVLDGFASLQVTKSDLEAYLGYPFAKASPAKISDLRKLGIAIKEGDTTWADAMAEASKPPPQGQNAPTPAAATTATPPTTQPQAQGATIAPAAEQPPKVAASPRAAKAGKGTEALKSQVGQSTFGAAADVARAKDAARTGPPPGVTIPAKTEVAADDPALDLVEVKCFTCDETIMQAPGTPPGQCEACRNA